MNDQGLEDLMGAFMGGGKKTKKNKADKKKTKKIVCEIFNKWKTQNVVLEHRFEQYLIAILLKFEWKINLKLINRFVEIWMKNKLKLIN